MKEIQQGKSEVLEATVAKLAVSEALFSPVSMPFKSTANGYMPQFGLERDLRDSISGTNLLEDIRDSTQHNCRMARIIKTGVIPDGN